MLHQQYNIGYIKKNKNKIKNKMPINFSNSSLSGINY